MAQKQRDINGALPGFVGPSEASFARSEMENQWRLASWDWGVYDDPYLVAEFRRDGTRDRLSVTQFPDYVPGMTFEGSEDLPASWNQLMDESCEDAEAVYGEDEGDGWHWKQGEAPTRWRPLAEWQELKAEVAAGGLPNAWMYQDDDLPST